MDLARIDGHTWTKLIVASSKYLEARKSRVDSLNVFPVPDGDTGTNMSLTLSSAAKAAQMKEYTQISAAAKAISYGALMGARGNSGVILSQILAGFAKKAEDYDELETLDFADALESATKTAYQAVSNPVEGTILTVSREASYAAGAAAKKSGSTIDMVLEAAYNAAVDTLKLTPTMLPVLQQAGVVDAGGQGLVFILEGMLKTLRGEIIDITPVYEKETLQENFQVSFESVPENFLEFQYCTEFILKKKESDLHLDDIRSYLFNKGNCLLVVGNQETGKIHIHTNNPGQVLEFCTALGSLHEVQIHNMAEQSQEMQTKAKALKHQGLISVSSGPGLDDIFKSLGVDVIIQGGQTMNPSTQDFLGAINQVLAEEIIILPNNSNIILAAQQAASVASKPVQVVTTKAITQGIASLMAFNAEHDLNDNRIKMEEAGKQITSIEITYAVRDAQYDGVDILKGQILGIADSTLVYAGDQVAVVVEEMLKKYLNPVHELVTIYYGEDISEGEARQLVEEFAHTWPEVDFELHYGGQPLYYYLISIE